MRLKYSNKRIDKCRSSPPMVFVGKGVLKICNKFTGEPFAEV